MKKGLVSILVPEAESEEAVSATVDALLEQTCESVEIIVARAREEEWMYQLESRFRKVQFLQTDEKEDVIARLFARSRGEWVGIVRAGDWYERTALELLLRRMKDMEADAGTCGVTILDEQERVQRTIHPEVGRILRGARLQHYFLRDGADNRQMGGKLFHRNIWEAVMEEQPGELTEQYVLTRLLYRTGGMAFLTMPGYFSRNAGEQYDLGMFHDWCRSVEFLDRHYPHLRERTWRQTLSRGCSILKEMRRIRSGELQMDRLYEQLEEMAGEKEGRTWQRKLQMMAARWMPELLSEDRD